MAIRVYLFVDERNDTLKALFEALFENIIFSALKFSFKILKTPLKIGTFKIKKTRWRKWYSHLSSKNGQSKFGRKSTGTPLKF